MTNTIVPINSSLTDTLVVSTGPFRPETPAWGCVERALLDHHHEPDLQAARLVYSVFAAHSLQGSPVWVMIVAPPGSMKTELLDALEGLPSVHFIDQLTPRTFISGQIGGRIEDDSGTSEHSSSLLHRIGNSGVLIYPDFSTVLAMNRENRASILADMRRIFDGHLKKEFGTADHLAQREWRGRITFLVAATPDVDRAYSVFQTLGERFVMVRWPRPGGIEAALRAMNQEKSTARRALRSAVHALFETLPEHEPDLPKRMQVGIAALTELAVRARTHVPRAGYSKDIIYVPEPEAATRLAQQLAQLAKGSALLSRRKTANQEDYRVVRRAAFDCMPAARRKIIDALMAGKQLRDADMPDSTRSYAKGDLQAQGLLDGDELSEMSRRLLELAEPSPDHDYGVIAA